MNGLEVDDDPRDPRDPRDRYRKPKSRLPLLLVLLLLVAIAIGAFYMYSTRNAVQPKTGTELDSVEQVERATQPPPPSTSPPRRDTTPPRERAPEARATDRMAEAELPLESDYEAMPIASPLDGSDERWRGPIGELSPGTRLASWLIGDDLLRTFVVAVDNIAEGRPPRLHLLALKPQGRFQVSEDDEGRLFMAPASAARYDTIGDVFVAVDAESAADVYDQIRPLLFEAYRELGYPDGDFDQTLERAFVELLQTPILDGPVELEAVSVSYSFADLDLEDLSAAQKQFLRMGSANVRRIQTRLRILAQALGMPVESFPEPRIVKPQSSGEGTSGAPESRWD